MEEQAPGGPGRGRTQGGFRVSDEDKTQQDRSFEESLQALEQVVERIESGELNLEDSLAAFEEGVRLVQSCDRKLSDVERRIEVLTKDSEGQARLKELVEDDKDDVEEFKGLDDDPPF